LYLDGSPAATATVYRYPDVDCRSAGRKVFTTTSFIFGVVIPKGTEMHAIQSKIYHLQFHPRLALAMALQQLLQISFFMLIASTAMAINPEAEALLRWKSTLVGANSLSSWSLAHSTC
jgi:hypothetical protein